MRAPYQTSFEARKPALIDRRAEAPAAGYGMPKTPPPYSDLLTGTGERLRATRIALGYKTAADACREFHVSEQLWSHWERDKGPPNIYTMMAIRNRHDVSLDWIFAGAASSLPYHLVQKLITLAAAPDAGPALKIFRAGLGIDPLAHGRLSTAARSAIRYQITFDLHKI
jgi:transcriptional regulator with XRE-family HTH domain